jgi:hypothetical protein
VTSAERAVLASARAGDLCLSLERAFAGPRALAGLRAGEAAALRPRALILALGLAWASGDIETIRTALASLEDDRIDADPVLTTFRAVAHG